MSQNIWRKKDAELTYSANTAQRKNKFFSSCLKGEKIIKNISETVGLNREFHMDDKYLWLLLDFYVYEYVCIYMHVYTYICVYICMSIRISRHIRCVKWLESQLLNFISGRHSASENLSFLSNLSRTAVKDNYLMLKWHQWENRSENFPLQLQKHAEWWIYFHFSWGPASHLKRSSSLTIQLCYYGVICSPSNSG